MKVKVGRFRSGGWRHKKSSSMLVMLLLYVIPRFLTWGATGELISKKMLMGGFFSYVIGGVLAFFLVSFFPYLCIFIAMYSAVVIWNWNIIIAIIVFSYPLIFVFYGFDIPVADGKLLSLGSRKLTRR